MSILLNLTTILADTSAAKFETGNLRFEIKNKTVTIHELLLQKSNGIYELVLWNEKLSGSDT